MTYNGFTFTHSNWTGALLGSLTPVYVASYITHDQFNSVSPSGVKFGPILVQRKCVMSKLEQAKVHGQVSGARSNDKIKSSAWCGVCVCGWVGGGANIGQHSASKNMMV